jgi:flagellar hook protein FlgE
VARLIRAVISLLGKGVNMSLIGSLNAAVGGMNAQAAALSSISDNVANSQTVGFKETDTAFADYVTQSSATFHAPGAVIGLPQYTNSVEGTVTQVANPTALAVSGSGFFAVQLPTGPTTFNPQQFYTRAGDFKPDNNDNLVNSSGYVLDGGPATNAAGTTFDTNGLGPIKISQDPSAPVPTANVTLAANLPASPPVGTTNYSSTVQVHDASGSTQNVTLNWAQLTAAGPVSGTNPVSATNPILPNQWDLTVNAPTATAGPTSGPYLVTFGATPADAGTITSIGAAGRGVGAPGATGTPATINLALNFGLGAQPIALNLGQFGSTTGVTQFAGTNYAVASQTQDGSTQGNFSSVTVRPTGDVVINYDNGSLKTVARVPLAHFGSPDSLQQQDGQAFTATTASGVANIVSAGTGGAGTRVVGAEEGSNVDIATQFTQMIVAQRAYTANSKVVTTANSMMQDALNMIQG